MAAAERVGGATGAGMAEVATEVATVAAKVVAAWEEAARAEAARAVEMGVAAMVVATAAAEGVVVVREV